MLRLFAQLTFFAVLIFLLRLPFAEDEMTVRSARVGAFNTTWAAQAGPEPVRLAVGGPVPVRFAQGGRIDHSEGPSPDGAEQSPVSMRRNDHRGELRVLQKKEEILREHFENLRQEADTVERERSAVERALAHLHEKRDRARLAALEQRLSSLESIEREIREARDMLIFISRDRERYEKWVRLSLPSGLRLRGSDSRSGMGLPRKTVSARQVAARRPSQPSQPQNVSLRRESADRSAEVEPDRFVLRWPVIHAKGLSAVFLDAAYERRFGMAHEAIDIPVEQGSEVFAAADGVVVAIADNGYGYNTITLEHESGLQTLYGHVSQFLVVEGERVREGQVIALSGGRPGSKGAGFLTTGPHLHFETRLYGQAIDPLYFLPEMDMVVAAR